MNKLTALIEAAKAAKAWNYFDAQEGNGEEVFDLFHDLANPATILELCALLEKAEEALQACDDELVRGASYTISHALAAIKQSKEQASPAERPLDRRVMPRDWRTENAEAATL